MDKAKELKEIDKYKVAMEYVRDRCIENKNIGYKYLQYQYNFQPIGIKAMILMGYIEKKSHGKYIWKTNKNITPFMARILYEWMKEYFLSTKQKQKLMKEQLVNVDECNIEDNREQSIIDDTMSVKEDTICAYRNALTSSKPTVNVNEDIKTIWFFGLKILSITKRRKAYDE